MKILLQLFIACLALRAFAMEAANSYVRIRTDCADVLSIKPVGKDFHLLVVNASAQATVEVSAIDPWELVEPISGSCSVTLAAEGAYEVKDAEPDEEGNYEPNKDGRIIMFKPSFSVNPDYPSGMYSLKWDRREKSQKEVFLPGSNGDLTDNHTASVHVFPTGLTSLKGHKVAMNVRLEEEDSGKLLHYPGVDPKSVKVHVNANTVMWRTSKIFWYGVSNDVSAVECCYWKKFNYIFELIVDDVSCYSQSCNVGWPKCTPAILATVKTPEIPIVPELFVMDSGDEKWKVTFQFRDCIRESRVSGMPYTSQYGTKMLDEENYHCRQFKGDVDLTCGGNTDLFTAAGASYWAKLKESWYNASGVVDVTITGNEVCVTGYSDRDVLEWASMVMNEAFEKECSESWNMVMSDSRRKWSEYKAKEHVKYNAAWKYHCTYGRGSEEVPSYEKHPAYRR